MPPKKVSLPSNRCYVMEHRRTLYARFVDLASIFFTGEYHSIPEVEFDEDELTEEADQHGFKRHVIKHQMTTKEKKIDKMNVDS